MNNEENNPLNQNSQIIINVQYVKDLSFESPNSPYSLTSVKEAPKVDLNLDVISNKLQDNSYEIVIEINSSVKAGDQQLFVVDLKYGALFTLTNIPNEHLESVLFVHCPSIIFPFARRIIADATRDGGFQPLMIDPIDFMAFYNNKKAKSSIN